MSYLRVVPFILPFLLVSCNSRIADLFNKQEELPQEEEVITEQIMLEPISVTDYDPESEVPKELEKYNAAAKKSFDLIHTALDLSFDWSKEKVIGTANLSLKPHFYPSNVVELDAVNFKLLSIRDLNTGYNLSYDYEEKAKLKIYLPKEYTREDTLNLGIDYYAFPSQSGGSRAITSDKGLFFINPTGKESKPQQIWTQGETEHNSKWFPTIDKPNSRTSQEIKLTVQDRFVTLSNGLLIDSKDNGDGTRTDHWLQTKPHTPYLFAVVVGDFAKVQDKWRSLDVDYYVEPEFQDYARDIFPYTVEMLEFFSTILGVDYPWDKYAQVAVRDFVSGAMENTSAVIFGDFMYGTDRDLIDVDINEKIVAHEMMHHWFGDLVTCESWANLTLNEGFANYSEYLWTEHKHGKGLADYHKMGEKEGYFSSLPYSKHPLIYYGYGDKEDMFDAHSYNKGGLVLHMLRYHIGDEAFFASCKKFLEDNAYSDVEVDELRIAFEEITGMDLNWFFDQWFMSSGQPTLSITKEFNPLNGNMNIELRQTHSNIDQPTIFQLPVEFEFVFSDGSRERRTSFVDSRDELIVFNLKEEPVLTIFDPENVLLAFINFNKENEELLKELEFATSFEHRFNAYNELLSAGIDMTEANEIAVKDEIWPIRQLAVKNITDAKYEGLLKSLVREDEHSMVRKEAFQALIEMDSVDCTNLSDYVIQNEKSYPVLSKALDYLLMSDSDELTVLASKLQDVDNPSILISLSKIYLSKKDVSKLSFYEESISRFRSYDLIDFLQYYTELLIFGDETQIKEGIVRLNKMSSSEDFNPIQRLSSTYALNNLYFKLKNVKSGDSSIQISSARAEELGSETKELLNLILQGEKDSTLLDYYQQFPVFN